MIAPRPRRAGRFQCILFHKPYHVLAQFTHGSSLPSGSQRRSTLADFVDLPGVYPVGRLDFDSEGLMLLTDDGELQHRLSHPQFEHERTYWVQVEGAITTEALTRLAAGLVIQGYKTKPCKASVIDEPPLPAREPPVRFRRSIPTSWIELILTEGRNRQVRHVTAAVGFPTLRLVRVAIETLRLDRLAPGAWRYLTSEEETELRRLAAGRVRPSVPGRSAPALKRRG